MKAEKKVDDFQLRWIYLDARSHHARLELPTGPLERLDRWAQEKLIDPWVVPVLKKMHANMDSEVLMGGHDCPGVPDAVPSPSPSSFTPHVGPQGRR